jgi:hypothetical protein
VVLAKDFSTQFNLLDLFALYQLPRTWQIGLTESAVSLLEASSSPLEQDFNPGPRGVMAKYHANGNIHDEVIMFKFAEIKEALKEEKINSKGRYMDLINTRELLEHRCSYNV